MVRSTGFVGILVAIIITAFTSAAITYIVFVSNYQYQLAQAKNKIESLNRQLNGSDTFSGGTGEATPTPTPTTQTSTKGQKTVKLYFYNQKADKDANNGATKCDAQFIQPVIRTIDNASSDPIKDTIDLLLQGNLTKDEQDKGFITSLPGDGFTLASDSLSNGTLTLTFNDPKQFAKGSSCHTESLHEQIIKTASQFDNVKSVAIKPDSLFK